jgi:hypothetical protein
LFTPQVLDGLNCQIWAFRQFRPVGYNVQVAVGTKHKLIVERQVTNQVVDMGY